MISFLTFKWCKSIHKKAVQRKVFARKSFAKGTIFYFYKRLVMVLQALCKSFTKAL